MFFSCHQFVLLLIIETTKGPAKTSAKGIFVDGDCREGAIAQVAAATGEGVLASYGIMDYPNGIKGS